MHIKNMHGNYLKIYLWLIQLREKENERRKQNPPGYSLNTYDNILLNIQLKKEEAGVHVV